MCHTHNEKWKREITERIEPPNQGRIRMQGEKGVLENIGSGHHRTSRDERENNKSISNKRENLSKRDS